MTTPLPAPTHSGPDGTGTYFDSFSSDQMRQYAADETKRLTAALAERDAEIERLTGSELGLNRHLATVQADLSKARKQIDAQRKVLEQAEVALEPFANDAKGIHEDWSNERRRASLTQAKPITVGDFRRAGLAFTAIQEQLK